MTRKPPSMAPIIGALERQIDASTSSSATLTPAQRRARGAAAEQRFRAWLDRCHLPHLYVEQSPLTFPRGLDHVLKRPDFLVGIPTIGTIAVDVKSKRVYDDALIIEAVEHTNLMTFETSFNIPVWFAAFPPEEDNTCHLFLNRRLAQFPVITRKQSNLIALPRNRTHVADDRRDFIAALMSAIRSK